MEAGPGEQKTCLLSPSLSFLFSKARTMRSVMGLKIGPVCTAIYWFEYPLTKRTKACAMAMNHVSKTVVYLDPAASVWQPASSFDHWWYSKSKHFSTLSSLGRRDTQENFQTGLSLYAVRFGLGTKRQSSLLVLWNKDSTCVGLITFGLLIHC